MTTTATPSGNSEIVQYDTHGSFNLTFKGAFAANHTSTVYFTKVGRSVTLRFSSLVGAVSSASTILLTGSNAIPADLLPANDLTLLVPGLDNSAAVNICVNISADGTISMGPNSGSSFTGTNFTNSGSAGFASFPVTYQSASGFLV